MPVFRALKRYAALALEPVRKAREAANREEHGAHSSVPGRHVASESSLSPWHMATLSTPTVLGFCVLAAAVLGWYYVHAYTHAHAMPKDPVPHPGELADSPLPPLQHSEVAGQAKDKAGGQGYIIGDILDADDGPSGAVAAAEAANGTNEANAYPDGAKLSRGPTLQPPQARRLEGSVFTRMASAAGDSSSTHADLQRLGDSSSAGASAEPTSVDRLLRSVVTPTVAAGVLPTQRLLLPKGAFLDCTLETAIDSTLPGLTTCITAFDTFSADGTVVLLERGTKLIGEMRSQVQQGTARVFVLWTEARTPKGIVVALASPGTDELGRSGVPGTVDRHFADRFGAAILVSVIGGAIQSMVNRSQQGGGTVILNPSGAGDVATEVLRNTLDIPPTVRIPQGKRVEVLVARDLDFRAVYSLQTR